MLSLRLLAVLIPTMSVLVAPTAAYAERVVIQDADADAQSVRADADEDVFAPAPEHAAADIIRTVVAHGARQVRVQVDFREIEGTLPRAAYVKVRTPGRRFDIQTSRDATETRTQLTRGQREDVVPCPGLRSSEDGGKDRLTVSVPTACLGGPAWVQVGVLSVAAEVGPGFVEPYFVYFDDAHMTGGFEDDGVRVGPRVLRG